MDIECLTTLLCVLVLHFFQYSVFYVKEDITLMDIQRGLFPLKH